MKCTLCGEEAEKTYRVMDDAPAFRNVCRRCALYWGETAPICYDCRKWLGRTAYELRGHYYCEQCFLQEAEPPKEDN